MIVLAALPIIALGLALLYLGAKGAWRSALIKAAVAWGVLVVANTEILSLFGALSAPWLAAAWFLECGVAAVGVWHRRREVGARLRALGLSRLTPPALLAVVPVALIVVATGVTAVVAPPNTWDSMTYHLAKVAHWAADGTVADYPTNIVWQLIYAPFAEYAVLQLQLLSGGDHLANLVQWLSMVGSLFGVSLIARQLGAAPRGQLLAVVVVATVPMGILEATSTQTDYVVAFWLVCCVSLALEFVARPTPQAAAWFASSLGLALLAKGNAYFFAAPLVLVLGLWMLVRLRLAVVVPALLMVAIPLAINAGFYLRNEALFHNPLASNQELAAVMIVGTITPESVMSNIVRDAAVQFGTPDLALNQRLEHYITRLHERILQTPLNDPNTTYPADFQINALSFNEDYAGDPLHSLLAIAVLVVAAGIAWRRRTPLPAIYAGALVLAFVLFAAYLKWQPWHSRLELPLLVLSAPLIGLVVSRVHVAIAGVIGAVLLVASVPWVIDNQTRPMFDLGINAPPQARSLGQGRTIFNTPRTDQYFVENKSLEAPYVAAVERAERTGCGEIGFWSGFDDWEYPLWALAQESGLKVRVDQIFVDNESVNATGFGSKPCLIVATVADQPAIIEVSGGAFFTKVSEESGVGVYAPS